MAKSLLQILQEREQFSDRGEPTNVYLGAGTDEISLVVEDYLESNESSPRRPSNRFPVGDDKNAETVLRNLESAARRDPSLSRLIENIQSMDDILFRELSKPYIGNAIMQGYQTNRYSPFGPQKQSVPSQTDKETMQFQTENGIEKKTLSNRGEEFLKDQTINPPGNSRPSRFREGILGTTDDGINEVLDFYKRNEERPRNGTGTDRNNDLNTARFVLNNGGNMATALDTPEKNSVLKSILKNNRFQPTGFNGLTPETYLGAREYSESGQNMANTYSTDDLPFQKSELRSTEQDNRYYYTLPSATENTDGGLAVVGDARIDQINESRKGRNSIGSSRTIDEIREALGDGDDLKVVIFQKGVNFGDKIASSADEIQSMRYFSLEPDVDPLYFQTLEQQTGQFINNDTPGLKELSISHLVYEMSKFNKPGPISKDDKSGLQEFRERGVVPTILAGAGDTIRQIGNRAIQEGRAELERLSGRSREISRALLAPRGSALRDVLKTTEFTSGAFGANNSGAGAQDQNSTDAIRARLRDLDNARRRMFASTGNEDPLSTLKERYKEGYLVLGNYERSYGEYENDFIGLAEDVQTVRDFFLKEGVERFYLSQNQVLISPFNNAKGRGMENFGIPQDKIDMQTIVNSSNVLGEKLERTRNRAIDMLSPFASRALAEDGINESLLVLGRGPTQDISGKSNSLTFMQNDFANDTIKDLYNGFIGADKKDKSMINILAKQLGRPEQMGTRLLPGSTLINADAINQASSEISNVKIDNRQTDPDSQATESQNRKNEPTLGSKIGSALRSAATNTIQSRFSSIANRLRGNIENGIYNDYNDPNQLEQNGDSWRISPQAVRIIEESLEAQYVPFYFQDLRTNEILSFHAFLSDLRDNFKPEWKTNKFIGRVDPVVMYAGQTQRDITLTFSVFATSPEDFGVLYEKVNRFIGFVYPQFDEGEEYRPEIGTGNDLKFAFANGGSGKAFIPFSQKQKAGPIIRMRVGDIIKSRAYDDSPGVAPAFTRRAEEFFGIKDVISVLDGDVDPLEGLSEDQETFSTIEDLNQQIKDQLTSEGFISVNGTPVSDLNFINPSNGQVQIPDGFAGQQITSINRSRIDLERPAGQDITTYNAALIDSIVNDVVSSAQTTYSDYESRVQQNQIRLMIASINRGNSIIRHSFETVGGRGLAGAVSNLQIALLDEFPWETQIGLRAPMGFKISFSYQVIHDLPPGLDSKGEMRPVYAPKVQDATNVFGPSTIPSFNPGAAPRISGNSDLVSRVQAPVEAQNSPRTGRRSGVAGNRFAATVISVSSLDRAAISVGDFTRTRRTTRIAVSGNIPKDSSPVSVDIGLSFLPPVSLNITSYTEDPPVGNTKRVVIFVDYVETRNPDANLADVTNSREMNGIRTTDIQRATIITGN